MNILDIVFPRMCNGCGREGSYICKECQRKLVKPAPICPMCCEPGLGGETHARCRSKYGMDGLWIGLPYKGIVQKCLKKVKYKSSWDIIRFLYQSSSLAGIRGDLVTSVPMWREKERERGFNQAEIIADLVCESLAGVARKVDLLERVRETRPMFGLNKKERRDNVVEAFRIVNQQTNRLLGRRIILVDDVWTTGATMRECAKLLKREGADEVRGLTLAR